MNTDTSHDTVLAHISHQGVRWDKHPGALPPVKQPNAAYA